MLLRWQTWIQRWAGALERGVCLVADMDTVLGGALERVCLLGTTWIQRCAGAVHVSGCAYWVANMGTVLGGCT